MNNAPLEMHVHGEIPLKHGSSRKAVDQALQPIEHYVRKRGQHFEQSLFPEESGIVFDPSASMLRFCWTVAGDIDFKAVLEELVMGLNEISRDGATLEVSIYDLEDESEDADEEEFAAALYEQYEDEKDQSRNDFYVLFVGPTPTAILQVQRNLLVEDVQHLMGRHFDSDELNGVVLEIDRLFQLRHTKLLEALHNSTHDLKSREFPPSLDLSTHGRSLRKSIRRTH